MSWRLAGLAGLVFNPATRNQLILLDFGRVGRVGRVIERIDRKEGPEPSSTTDSMQKPSPTLPLRTLSAWQVGAPTLPTLPTPTFVSNINWLQAGGVKINPANPAITNRARLSALSRSA